MTLHLPSICLLLLSLFSLCSSQTCEEFELKDTECWTLLKNTLVFVPDDVDQQTMFDQIALTISDVRMLLPECRRPAVSFLCRSTFVSCPDAELPCEDCRLARKNCPEFPLDDCDLFCTSSRSSSPRSSLSSPIPVVTCMNDTEPEIECCPEPFFFDDDVECDAPSCPYYTYGEDKQEALVLTYFILTWIAVVVSFIGMIPQLYYQGIKTFKSLAQVLILCVCFYLLSTNWGIYVGAWDYECEYDSFSDFDHSAYCLTQAFLFCFTLYFSVFIFFWYSCRVFGAAFQHAAVWERYSLPKDIPPAYIYLPISLIVSFAFPLSFILYARANPEDQVVQTTANFQCTAVPWDMGLYLVWLPLLIICTFATSLVIATIIRLIFITITIPKRFILVLFLFAFVFQTAIIHTIYYSRYKDDLPEFTSDWIICVASRPQQADYVDQFCSLESVGFAMIAYVQISSAVLPIIFQFILSFSRKEYWLEMKGIILSSEESSLGSTRKSTSKELQLHNEL